MTGSLDFDRNEQIFELLSYHVHNHPHCTLEGTDMYVVPPPDSRRILHFCMGCQNILRFLRENTFG